MENEYLFVQHCLKKNNISVAALSEKAGLAEPTVYEYIGGRKKYIPLQIYKALFELTEDVSIIELVTGSVETFVVPVPKPAIKNTSEEMLKNLIEKRKKDLQCELAILDILGDGKIDGDDRKAIEQYREIHPDAVKLDAQIFYSIMKQYNDALNKS